MLGFNFIPGGTVWERLSVIVVNYNYEEFVGQAIESALNLDWPEVEVVVVDDGSTDSSRQVIQSYSDKIVTLFTENATQRVAANRGLALSSGDVIVFLDSDDVLPSDLAWRAASHWTAATSKMQFRMQRIDRAGEQRGVPFPPFRPVPSPREIRTWAQRTSAYPTPPGSGNAYARWFLERIFPIGPELGNSADSACLAAAPFYGDVVTVPEVVVGYRRHGGNDSNLLLNASRFAREVERAAARWRFAQQSEGYVGPRTDSALFRSRELLQLRVSAYRVSPEERPLSDDHLCRMLGDALRSPWHPGSEPWVRRFAISIWCIAALLAPPPLAWWLIQIRYGRDS